MPELPEVSAYLAALEPRVVRRRLERVRITGPFLLHSVDPPLESAFGRTVTGVSRLGKRIVMALEGELFLVLHLMIAGRLKWVPPGAPVPRKVGLAAFDFEGGTLVLTEAGSKRRATLHLAGSKAALEALDPGGIEPLECTLEAFTEALIRENHTVKRALTDPRLLSGIGNAYSDEILWRARMSPTKLTRSLTEDDIRELRDAVRDTLREWTDRLIREQGDEFPKKVSAFHPRRAVHGRYGEPCPRCGRPVQRIAYASNETNYCAACQTGGRLLSDRAFARLLKQDWPKRLEDLELHWQRLKGAAPD